MSSERKIPVLGGSRRSRSARKNPFNTKKFNEVRHGSDFFFVLEPQEIEIGGSAVVELFIFPASEAPDIAL